ncbi:MAG TPA: tripartite tricarboxylate transporter TctB family protein [Ramlibacter sp.]|nr:tripartite tricarboxylate transporter TctB family protein [Ramlibacter sp.]
MRLRIHDQKDFGAGLLYMGFGAAFSLGALDYKMGDAARMGPGWFPFWVGLLLVLVGVLTAASGLRAGGTAEKIRRPQLAPLAWVIGAVVLFGLALEPLGLVLALTLLVVVSMRASHEFRWAPAIATAVALILFSIGVFVWGIDLLIDLWPATFG